MRLLFGDSWKHFNEWLFWWYTKRWRGQHENSHYESLFTDLFGLDREFFADKTVLDIGCGPNGSMEWMDHAKRRVGLDPLVASYLKLGASSHKMEYVEASSEDMPFEDGEFAIIASLNSLDHVSSIPKTAEEIKRVVADQGHFLLFVEINHPPTACEPHELTAEQLQQMFLPELTCESHHVYPKGDPSIPFWTQDEVEHPFEYSGPGYFVGVLKKG